MMAADITVIDGADLMGHPPQPVLWAVEDLLPAGTVVDLFGLPGAGKTTLVTDLSLSFAAEVGTWHGLACWGGPVVILGGERTDPAALARDLHRTGRPRPPKGSLLVPTDTHGDCPPLWRWERRADGGAGAWLLTPWGARVSEWLAATRPVLVVVDTILSAAQGCDLLDGPQQYALGQAIRRWAKVTCAAVTITVSHTNQASALQGLSDRLDYLSRAGGNGYPGSLRHLAGLTRLRKDEVPGLDPAQDRTLFAVGVSKHNESPPTRWAHYAPAIFSQACGRLELVMDGAEVAERLARGGRHDAGASNLKVVKGKRNGAL